jgi:BirA family biotin operon repressor/biotin-[acetyl-CoA-carboxylase] ligase
MSLLLRPACGARDIGQLSLLSALALAETLGERLKDTRVLTLKWPNDVLLKRRKCAGLILETEIVAGGGIEWLVMGIGVNISASPLEAGACLNDFAKVPASPSQVRDSFLDNFSSLYVDWQARGFDPVRKGWLSYAHAPGTGLSVQIGLDRKVGTFHAIDEQGNLLLQVPGYGIQTITAGDVYLNP